MVKAACHVHSDWSYDGKWPLSDLAAAFPRRGYRVLLMTEHDRGFSEERLQIYKEECARASSPSCLVIPGIEYSDADNVVHVLVWGAVPFLGEGRRTSDVLQRVAEHNGVAVLAHPSRRGAWMRFDENWTPLLTGIELWNRKTDGWARSRPAAELLARTRLSAFAGLDFHERNQFFPLAMKLDVDGAVTEEGVLAALRENRLEATAFNRPAQDFSSGVELAMLSASEFCRRRAALIYRGLRRACS